MMRAINQTKGTVLCPRLEIADGTAGRARGLLGRTSIAPDEGLLFVRGRLEPFMLMHMFFMRFAIDIVFLDRDERVVRISRELKPWRLSPIVFTARQALELAPGAVTRSDTVVGDSIRIVEG
jgi:uncharacterized membrane protein (UPF0127 family)